MGRYAKLAANNKPLSIRPWAPTDFDAPGEGLSEPVSVDAVGRPQALVFGAATNVQTLCPTALCPLGLLALSLFTAGPGNLRAIPLPHVHNFQANLSFWTSYMLSVNGHSQFKEPKFSAHDSSPLILHISGRAQTAKQNYSKYLKKREGNAVNWLHKWQMSQFARGQWNNSGLRHKGKTLPLLDWRTKTRGDDTGGQGAGSAAGVSAESWSHREAAATTVKAARGGRGRNTLFSFPRPLQPRVSVPQAWLLCPSRRKSLRTVPVGPAPWDRVHQGRGKEWVWAQTDASTCLTT